MENKEVFLIKNASQLQAFMGMFSAALVGCTATMKDSTPCETAHRADMIAVEAIRIFETHIPGTGEISPQEDIDIIIPPKTTRGEGNEH